MTPLMSATPHWNIPQLSSHLLFYLINTLCKKQRWAASIVGSSRLEPHGKSRHHSKEPFSHLLSKNSCSRFLKLLRTGGQWEPEDEGVSKDSGGWGIYPLSHLYGLPLTGGVPHSRRRVLPHSRPTWRAGMSLDNFSQLTSLCVSTLHLFLLLFLMSAVNCIALSSPNFNVKHMCFCKEQSHLRETHVRTRPEVCFPQAQRFGPHLFTFFGQKHKYIYLWIIILMALFPHKLYSDT